MELYAEAAMQVSRVFKDNDPADYVKRYSLDIYKMPEDEEEYEKVLDGEENDKNNLVCTIDGSLILSIQAVSEGEDIVSLCNVIDNVLEHIAAAIESADVLPEDTFAIENITRGPACDSEETLIEALHMLPRFIFKAYNVNPVIAVFPLPLPYEKSISQKVKEKYARKIYADRLEAFFKEITSTTQDEDEDGGRTTTLTTLDEEQENYIHGIYNKDNPYPLEAKNTHKWDLLESAGFKEIGKTMVLCFKTPNIFE